MIARAVIDFPLPDSPTIPIVSPGPRTRSAAVTIVSRRPPGRMRSTRSPSTSSTGPGPASRLTAGSDSELTGRPPGW